MELHRPEAGGDRPVGVGAHRVEVAEPRQAGVHRDAVVGDAAQQRRHRHGDVLCEQVPEGDVDAAQRASDDPVIAVLIRGADRAMPPGLDVIDGLDPHARGQRCQQVVDRRLVRPNRITRRQVGAMDAPPRLARASPAVLGDHVHQQLGIGRVLEHLRLDGGDAEARAHQTGLLAGVGASGATSVTVSGNG